MPADPEAGWRESSTGHQSAVLLALPQLAEFTHPWRATSYAPGHLDLPIERRFPPHLTVLVPWVEEPTSPEALARLRAAVDGHGPLDLEFARAGAFPAGTVYLLPDPVDAVVALLERVHRAFPEHPPYDGVHDDVHPHLTVSVEGGRPLLAEVATALADQGPLRVTVDELTVWQRSDDDGIWTQVAAVPLA